MEDSNDRDSETVKGYPYTDLSKIDMTGAKFGHHIASETAWYIFPNDTYALMGPTDVDTFHLSDPSVGIVVMESLPPMSKVMK
jgi:hypothetical protein